MSDRDDTRVDVTLDPEKHVRFRVRDADGNILLATPEKADDPNNM